MMKRFLISFFSLTRDRILIVLFLLTASLVIAQKAIEPIQAPFEMPQLQRPVFAERGFLITDFGAKGDSVAKNTIAFRKAIEACNKAGGGKVIVPKGKWLTGAIHLKSNVNLHVQEGAEIHFSDDPNDYLPVVFTRWAGTEVMNYSPLIYANNCENIAITGPGKLFGHGEKWWDWRNKLDERNIVSPRLLKMGEQGINITQRIFGNPEVGLRPQFINPVNCRNVLLEDFTIAQPGPFWTIHITYSTNIIVRGLTLNTKGAYNGDGINFDSSTNGLVEYCILNVGDDAVCLKSGINYDGRRVARPTENIVVRHLTAYECHGGVVIGSEMSGGVRNVYVHDCFFDGSDVGIRLKSNASRGGFVENCYYENIQMKNMLIEAIQLITNYSAWGTAGTESFHPAFRNINIKNITCEETNRAINVMGSSEKPIENLSLENVNITHAKNGIGISWVNGLSLQNVSCNGSEFKFTSISNCINVHQSKSEEGE